MTAEYELTNTESTNYQKPDQAAFSFEIGKADENEVQIVTVDGKVYGDAPFDLEVSGQKGTGAVIYSVPEDNGVLELPDNHGSDVKIIGGPNEEMLGERFSDMSEIYRKDLCEIIRGAAADLQILLQEGTYIQLSGPNFETPHEVKMCRILGGDAVGMSTACEAIAANHMGMKVCGISCISNLGCGMTDQPLSAEEVKETADRVAPLFKQLITESIVRIGKMI